MNQDQMKRKEEQAKLLDLYYKIEAYLKYLEEHILEEVQPEEATSNED